MSETVMDALVGVSSGLDSLSKAIDELDARLDGVLAPAPPQTPTTGNDAKEATSALVNEIDGVARSINFRVSRLQEITLRVTL